MSNPGRILILDLVRLVFLVALASLLALVTLDAIPVVQDMSGIHALGVLIAFPYLYTEGLIRLLDRFGVSFARPADFHPVTATDGGQEDAK